MLMMPLFTWEEPRAVSVSSIEKGKASVSWTLIVWAMNPFSHELPTTNRRGRKAHSSKEGSWTLNLKQHKLSVLDFALVS